MPRTFKRIYIAPGVVRDGDHYVATVTVGSARRGTRRRISKSFPLTTELDTIRAWQHGQERDFLIAGPVATRGTLAADVDTFVASLPVGAYRVDSRYLLGHWTATPLGQMARSAITRLDVLSQIAAWSDAGVAVSTTNHRLSRLRKLFHALDGPTAPNPTDAIKRQRGPEGEPRDIPIRIVKLILDSLPDVGRAERGEDRPTISKTKLRLTVFAWTGIPPAQMARVKPRDLDLTGGRVYLRPRRKGKGADGAWVALLPQAVEAFRAFVAAGLCGHRASPSSMGKTWRVGIARATTTAARIAAEGDDTWAKEIAALPPRCKPYDLRHSFASEIYAVTGDIRAVAELLQHADLETTKRYTKGAVSDRVTAAIAKAATVYASAPSAPAAKPRRLRLVRKS